MRTVEKGMFVSAIGTSHHPIQRVNAGTVDVVCKNQDLCGVRWLSGDWTWWRVDNLREMSRQEWDELAVSHVMGS